MTGTNRSRAWSQVKMIKSHYIDFLFILCSCECAKNIQPLLVSLAEGKHLFPFRTQKWRPLTPRILVWKRTGNIGRCQLSILEEPLGSSFFLLSFGDCFMLVYCYLEYFKLLLLNQIKLIWLFIGVRHLIVVIWWRLCNQYLFFLFFFLFVAIDIVMYLLYTKYILEIWSFLLNFALWGNIDKLLKNCYNFSIINIASIDLPNNF